MGSLINLGDNPNIQNFPGARFVITNNVPNTQCAEARIESTTGLTNIAPARIEDAGKFAGFALTGKWCTITESTGPVTGTFQITSNTQDQITFADPLGVDETVTYYVHDGGTLELTRDIESFAQFIHDAGRAYTIKGGKLYTDIPPGLLQPACTITFDPLT